MRALIDELSLLVEEVRVDVHVTRCIVTSVVDGSQDADSTPGVLDGARVRDSKLLRLTARGSQEPVEGKDTVRPVVDVR
jgi:hypothetical protein